MNRLYLVAIPKESDCPAGTFARNSTRFSAVRKDAAGFFNKNKSMEGKDATIKISLRSDSGYSCDMKGRIEVDQWEQINTIIDTGYCIPNLQSELENANKEIDTVEQERDELFVELEKAKELITKKDIEIAMLEKAIRELKGDTRKNDKGEY